MQIMRPNSLSMLVTAGLSGGVSALGPTLSNLLLDGMRREFNSWGSKIHL